MSERREMEAVDSSDSQESLKTDGGHQCSRRSGKQQFRVIADRQRRPAISMVGKQKQERPATVRGHYREAEVTGVTDHQETDSSELLQTDRGSQGCRA